MALKLPTELSYGPRLLLLLPVLGARLQQRAGKARAETVGVRDSLCALQQIPTLISQNVSLCRELIGIEYVLDSCQEPHLFVICKQSRRTTDMVAPEMFYYILDGSVYQTPTIHAVFSARLVSLPHAKQQK